MNGAQTPPCPWWCQDGGHEPYHAEHPHNSWLLWERSHQTVHNRPDPRVRVFVQQFETLRQDGPSEVEPVGIHMLVDMDGEFTYSPDQCRRIAAALLDAADRLEEIIEVPTINH